MLLMAAGISATASLSAEPKQIPFRGSYDAQFQNTLAYPIVHVTVQGTGVAMVLGRSQAVTDNEFVNLLTGAGTATFTLTAANGDTLVLEDTFHTTPPDSGGAFTFGGDFEVVGGTGRFAGATGGGAVTGSAQFTGPSGDGGVAEFSFDGTISSPRKK
jgi:hypothetical protein